MAKAKTTSTKVADTKIADSKILALIGYALGIIGFIVIYLIAKEDKYAMYYAKQGLILNIGAWVVIIVLGLIPIIGWALIPIAGLATLILWIIGIVYALSGEQKPVPLVGSVADKFNL